MEIYTIEIIEPKAKKLLDDLANLNLIKLQKVENPKNPTRKAGSAKGKYKLTSDFDSPLEDFEEYM